MNYNLQNLYICLKLKKMAKITLTPLEINQLVDNYKSELRKLEFQVEAVKTAIGQLEGGPVTPTTILAPVEEKKSEPKKRGPKPKNIETPAAPEAPVLAEKPVAAEAPKKRGPKSKAVAGAPDAPKAPKTKVAKAPKAEKAAKAEKAQKPATKAPKAEKAAKTETPVASEKPVKTRKPKTAAAPKEEPKAPAKKGRPRTKNTDETPTSTEKQKKAKPGPTSAFSEWDSFILETMTRVGKPMANADLLDYMKTERDARSNEKEYQIGDSRLKELLNRSLQKLGNKMDLLVKENYEGRGYLYRLK